MCQRDNWGNLPHRENGRVNSSVEACRLISQVVADRRLKLSNRPFPGALCIDPNQTGEPLPRGLRAQIVLLMPRLAGVLRNTLLTPCNPALPPGTR